MSHQYHDVADMVFPVPEEIIVGKVGVQKAVTQRSYRGVTLLAQQEKKLEKQLATHEESGAEVPNPKRRVVQKPTIVKLCDQGIHVDIPDSLKIFTDLATERQKLIRDGKHKEAVTLTVDNFSPPPTATSRTESRTSRPMSATSTGTTRGRPTSAKPATTHGDPSQHQPSRPGSARPPTNTTERPTSASVKAQRPDSAKSTLSTARTNGSENANTNHKVIVRPDSAQSSKSQSGTTKTVNVVEPDTAHQSGELEHQTVSGSVGPKPKHAQLSMSEKIARLYSPTAIVRTEKRDSQMDPYTFRRTYRVGQSPDDESLVIPIQNLHSGILGDDPALSHFLDPHDFDDDSHDLSPDEILQPVREGGEVLGFSQYFVQGKTTNDGHYVWAQCSILDYHPVEQKYFIRWVSPSGGVQQQTKWVKRLNLRLSFENPKAFALRTERAVALRDDAERHLRRELFVKSLSEKVISPQQEESIDRILYLVAQRFEKRHLELIQNNLTEIQGVWGSAIKESVFSYLMMDPKEQRKVADLNLPEFPEFDHGVTYVDVTSLHGTVDSGCIDFKSNRLALSVNLFLAHPPLYKAVYEVVNKWHMFQDRLLVDSVMQSVHLPCEVRDFQIHQSKHMHKVAESLRHEWGQNIIAVVQQDLMSVFNFYEDNKERFYTSRMWRFFTMINLILAHQLQDLVSRSVQQYAAMFKAYAVTDDMVNVLSKATKPTNDFLQFVGGNIESINLATEPPSIRNSIAMEKESLKQSTTSLNTSSTNATSDGGRRKSNAVVLLDDKAPNQGSRARDRRRSSGLAALSMSMQDIPAETQPQPSGKPETKGFSAKAVSGRTSLFVIRLTANGKKIVYDPPLEEVAATIKDTLTNFIDATDDLQGVGEQLFPLLTLPPVKLTENAKRNRSSDHHLINSQRQIQSVIDKNLRGPMLLETLYEQFNYLLDINIPDFVKMFATMEPAPKLEDYDHICDRVTLHLSEIQSRSLNEVSFPLVKVECYEVKQILGKKGKDLIRAIMEHLVQATDANILRVDDSFSSTYDKIQVEPETPEELNELRTFIDNVPTVVLQLGQEFDEITLSVQLLGKYGCMPSEQVFQRYWAAYSWPRKIQSVLDDSAFRLQGYRQQFTNKLRENNEQLLIDITELTKDVGAFAFEDDETQEDELYVRVEKIEAQFKNLKSLAERYNRHEEIFSMPVTKWTAIRELEKQFANYGSLWRIVKESKQLDGWYDQSVTKLPAESISSLHQNWSKEITRLSRALAQEAPIKVVNVMKEKLDAFKPYIPLVCALVKQSLRGRHWTEIGSFIGKEKFDFGNTNLTELIKMKLPDHISKIQEVTENADNEDKLESELGKMRTDWNKVHFTLQNYKETKLLKDTDDIIALLDDHIGKTQTMLSSPFVGNIISEVKPWEQKLLKMQAIIEEWLKCQSVWYYLEPIFCSPDIKKSMEEESKLFELVNAMWVQVMDSTSKTPYVLSKCAEERLHPQFHEANQRLDKILKELHKFLETKQTAFPRFFFLSNDDLLEILSETKEPRLVQKHLRKCFEGINRLTFADNNDITEMSSEEGEVVKLVTTVNPSEHDNMVEIWLYKVEQVMCDTIRDNISRAIIDYKSGKSRGEWLLSWPGQVVICASQFYWTQEVEEAITTNTLGDYEEKCNKQLEGLVYMVRGNLTPVGMMTLQALVVIEVHARDIVTELRRDNVNSIDAFSWLAQLRYYYESYKLDKYRTSNDTFVRQTIATLQYGNEYLGNQGRLVITPLTDRCYRTLTSALHLNYGGAPEGPAGTGKTETTKDLAKAIAKQCVVYNCSDQIKAVEMEKLLRGLASSGAWACFDEFNRIEIQVLSVIAQQVLTIQLAVAENKLEFLFEEKMCTLKKGCSVFITMNPGYAGRSDLPDNLKNLFRPVAMMVPDYALIGEISLFSCGFLHGRDLARKIVSVYKLCSEQLSSQNHYDYGMRAVKAVLTAAARLKRDSPDQDEQEVILRAIQDVNLAKFLAQDAVLFKGIISDLFPSTVLPDPDYSGIHAGMEIACQEMNLQKTEFFTIKTLQLYEMVCVRHGVMVVGYSISGKSSALKVLARTLTWTHQERKQDFKTILHVLNPKSVTMDQLYGCNDATGTDWHDGILSNIFRTCAADESPVRQWLVLDGPVDAIWIENMNTVLDDNKKLCLTSGAIIRMTSYMTMIFEVQDLAVASPATVSRCGMIYMEPNELGWRPLFTSWKHTLPPFVKGSEVLQRVLHDMFEAFIDKCLEFTRKAMKSMITLSEQTLMASLLRLYGTFLLQYFGEKSGAEKRAERDNQTHIEALFLFSLVWSAGAIAKTDGRKSFDKWIRETHEKGGYKFNIALPERNMYEYAYLVPQEGEGRWETWLNTIEEFKIPENAQYQDIMVPTPDTARYKFLVKRFIDSNMPVLMVGGTGTGKTVMAKNVMMALDSGTHVPVFLQFSAQTSAAQTQFMIESRLDKRGGRNYGPPIGKRCIILVDDMSMPDPDTYGAQPPIELLRQWMDYGGWYEHKKSDVGFKKILNTMFVACVQPPEGGRGVTLRFLRHFNTVAITPFDDESMTKIFTTLLDWIITTCRMSPNFRSMLTMTVNATIEIYNTASEKLLPTPEKSHYTFNLRDVWKVFQGMSLCPGNCVKEEKDYQMLWVHENLRVFQDRLINNTDREWFKGLMNTALQKFFKKTYESVVTVEQLIFDDFANEERNYQLISDMTTGLSALEHHCARFREESKAGKGGSQIIVFNYVMQHVARISRIIKLPGGNALLIGVGGSGRTSACKLAAYIGEFQVRTCTPSRKYTRDSWKEDMINVLRFAGEKGNSTIFILNDGQIKEESFLEDVSNLLNTGEIPNLFPPDITDQICEYVKPMAKEAGYETSKEMCWSFFVKRCRANLHVVMCMSPVGTTLRVRLRRFPSLVNCSTIDWFSEWPTEGLKNVATAALSDPSLELSDEERTSVVEVFVNMHTSVESTTSQYLKQQKQYVYVTPTSYLELIATFKQLIVEKRKELTSVRQKYDAGLQQLFRTEAQIAHMKTVLQASQPKIDEARKKTSELIIVIDKESEEAKKEHAIVAVDEEKANREAEAASEVKRDCEENLAIAMPSLIEATQAVSQMDKRQLVELRSMQRVNDKALRVLKAVCICLGDVKPLIKPDPDNPAKKIEDWWTVIKTKVMADVEEFKMRLVDYPKDNMSEEIFEVKLKPYIQDKTFKPEAVESVSQALVGVTKWVIAMEKYYRVAKVVKPKQEKLRLAEESLAIAMGELNEKKAILKAVDDRIAVLRNNLQENMEKKKALEDEYNTTQIKLERAMEIQNGLGGERKRYSEQSAEYGEKLLSVLGDVLLSSGLLSYVGPFTNEYRHRLLEDWTKVITTHNLKISPKYTLDTFLGDPVEIQKWKLSGLPADDFSVDGGIIMKAARRWPLLIDPQGQANAFIKQYAKACGEKLIQIRPGESNMQSQLSIAIQHGYSCLLENCGQELDPFLEPVLLKSFFLYAGKLNIMLGDTTVQYDPKFKLYMTTKLPAPHYKPETSTKVSLIAFFITPKGLQDQMLQKVVQNEDKDQEDRKNRYVEQSAQNKAQLRELEDKILSMLASDVDLLESEEAIEQLKTSKAVSLQLDQKQSEVESFNKMFEKTRNRFLPVASRGSVLFFIVTELCNIDPMYQYSLQWYLELFQRSLEQSEKGEKEERIRNINTHFLYSLYCNICRSLFSKDTLVFSFNVASKLGNMDVSELRWVLTGGADIPLTKVHSVRPEFVLDIAWNMVCRASEQVPSLPKFSADVAKDQDKLFSTIVNSPTPHLCPLPPAYDKITPVQKLLILRCLRPDRLVQATVKFVTETLGSEFVNPPLLDVSAVFHDTRDATIPLIFIISPGSDPMTIVRKIADEERMMEKLDSLSLGQGMDERAKLLITNGINRGNWVMLQNCHLYKDWMPALERIARKD